MLALPGSNRLTLILTVLLVLAAVMAFPCAASAMDSTDSSMEIVSEVDAQPRAEVAQSPDMLFDRNPEIGPLIVFIARTVVTGLITSAITHPNTTARVVTDAVNFVAEAYESSGEKCVNSHWNC